MSDTLTSATEKHVHLSGGEQSFLSPFVLVFDVVLMVAGPVEIILSQIVSAKSYTATLLAGLMLTLFSLVWHAFRTLHQAEKAREFSSCGGGCSEIYCADYQKSIAFMLLNIGGEGRALFFILTF